MKFLFFGFFFVFTLISKSFILYPLDIKMSIGVIRGIILYIPLEGMEQTKFLENSLEYIPIDSVKDGLPHFGALRDDWKNRTRNHKGLDIYINNVNVVASAQGIVTGHGWGKRAGGWIKIDHGAGIETMYIHLKKIYVHKGKSVKKHERIGQISGPVGNAVEPQLHFELKMDGKSIDPIPLFYMIADEKLKKRINDAIQAIPGKVEKRRQMVFSYLQNKKKKLDRKKIDRRITYSIQVGAYRVFINAKRTVNEYKMMGYNAQIIQKRKNKEKFFIVAVGKFSSSIKATEFKKKLEAEMKKSFYILKIN